MTGLDDLIDRADREIAIRHGYVRTVEELVAALVATRDALIEVLDAFDECTGDYAEELAADDLARWRALVTS